MTMEEKLQAIAENVPKVYEAGRQAEYDVLWDKLQPLKAGADRKSTRLNSSH